MCLKKMTLWVKEELYIFSVFFVVVNIAIDLITELYKKAISHSDLGFCFKQRPFGLVVKICAIGTDLAIGSEGVYFTV